MLVNLSHTLSLYATVEKQYCEDGKREVWEEKRNEGITSRVLHCQIFKTTSSHYQHLWGKRVESGWLKRLIWTVCHAVGTMQEDQTSQS